MPIWIKEKLFQKDLLRRELETIAPDVDWCQRLLFSEHHISHAASAYYPSPFAEALVLTLDGVGEWCTTSAGIGRGSELSIERELHFPHSLGLLYSAVTSTPAARSTRANTRSWGSPPTASRAMPPPSSIISWT